MAESDERLSFEREKWQDERAMRARDLELRERDQRRSSWGSPLVVAIAAGALAALTNAGIAWNNARQQIAVEDRKAEAARILEVIKLSDAEAVRKQPALPDRSGADHRCEAQDGLRRTIRGDAEQREPPPAVADRARRAGEPSPLSARHRDQRL